MRTQVHEMVKDIYKKEKTGHFSDDKPIGFGAKVGRF